MMPNKGAPANAGTLFAVAWGNFLFGVNLVLCHIDGQIVYDAGFCTFYGDVAQVVLHIGNDG